MVVDLAGKKCFIETSGASAAMVFVGVLPGSGDGLYEAVAAKTDSAFSMLVFELPEWEIACAPWDANIGDRKVIGGAEDTLEWLQIHAIPKIGTDTCMIAGYSMAGLLAMWTLYNSDRFIGAACCSGSLWYPGWKEYAARNGICSNGAAVYLSLGGKEARSAPLYMRSIEDNTRAQYERMKKDVNVRNSVLQMNPGGHFTQTRDRLAKGIAWLLNENQHNKSTGTAE